MGKTARVLRRPRPGGGFYPNWYAPRWNGVRWVWASTRCRGKRAAQAVSAEWERLAADPGSAIAEQCLLIDAINEKLSRDLARVKAKQIKAGTYSYYQGKCRALAAHWPQGTTLAQVTPVTVDSYRVLRVQTVSPQEAGKELEALRQVMVVAKRAGWWNGDPTSLMPPRHRIGSKPRERWMPYAEADALLAALPPHRAAIVAFALAFASSPAPTLRARAEDAAGGVVWLRDSKNIHRPRAVPILRHVSRYALGALWWLAWSGEFQRWPHGVISRDLRAACKRAGIKPVTLTDCRRSWCHWALHEGIPEAAAARYCGHANSRMLRTVYARATSGKALLGLLKDFV